MSAVAPNSEAPAWFTGDFSDLPDRHFDIEGGQRSSMRPRFKVSGYRRIPQGGKIENDLQWLIRVDCTNSSVHPGSLIWNREDKRGYFTHALKVRIGFRDEDGYSSVWSLPGTSR
jgi:hypothetical protein